MPPTDIPPTMKIAVTGGTGFIGSYFLSEAFKRGIKLLAFRRSPLSIPRIALNDEPLWLCRSLENITAHDLQGFDVLVHFASHTANVPYDTLQECIKYNLVSTLSLFDQARLAGIKRFIVAGSCFEYGHSGTRYREIPTNAPLEPTNSYSASKAAASIALQQWSQEHKLSLEILRVFHAFGVGEPQSRLWPSLREAALTGSDFRMTHGEPIRDFIPVEDVAKIFLHRSLTNDYQDSTTHIFNVGSGNPMSLLNFAEDWWTRFNASGKLMPGSVPYRPGEIFRYVPGPNLLTWESISKSQHAQRPFS